MTHKFLQAWAPKGQVIQGWVCDLQATQNINKETSYFFPSTNTY